MGLREWQRGLAALIVAPAAAPAAIDGAGLSAGERAWLARTADDPGLRVTREVQRAWRRIRLTSALPLTMAALDPEGRRALLDAYCDACPCVSFFHAHEGRAFARWIAAAPGAEPHARSLAALEAAIAAVSEWRLFDGAPAAADVAADARLALHPAAARITFAAPPEAVIGAILAGVAPPAAGAAEHAMIVAPGVAALGRALGADEARLLGACAGGATRAALAATTPGGDAAVARLLAERVLEPVP